MTRRMFIRQSGLDETRNARIDGWRRSLGLALRASQMSKSEMRLDLERAVRNTASMYVSNEDQDEKK